MPRRGSLGSRLVAAGDWGEESENRGYRGLCGLREVFWN